MPARVSHKLAQAIARASARGKAAAEAGQPTTANPYRAYELKRSWDMGHATVQREAPLLTVNTTAPEAKT
jgi:hypothetical protein